MSFNGGLTQGQGDYPQVGGDFPFINHLKMAQEWAFPSGDTPANLDSNGYPLTITNGSYITVFPTETAAQRPGNWVITWSGEGSGTITGGTFSGVNGRVVFNPGAGQAQFTLTLVTTNPANHMNNIAVFHLADETIVYNSGEIFGTAFKSLLTQANFGVWRFLKWSESEFSNVAIWAHRKPTTYAYYSGVEFRANLFAGTTTNSGDTYSVAAPSVWGGLVDKATVQVIWNSNAATTSPTLNVGGTGAILVVSDNGDTIINKPITGSISTLVYDAVLNSWMNWGGNPTDGNVGLISGVPPEICLQLCIEQGMHPFFDSVSDDGRPNN